MAVTTKYGKLYMVVKVEILYIQEQSFGLDSKAIYSRVSYNVLPTKSNERLFMLREMY